MTSTLDRLLRPFRKPKERPPRRVRPRDLEGVPPPDPDAEAVIAAFPRDGASIRPITRAEFEDMISVYPYYRRRWRYTSIAAAQAATLITDHGLRNALEMGTPVRPIVVGADVMDIATRPELLPGIQVTIHDATVTPWPQSDKQYDLFLALQVFEHLGDKQPEAFLEVRRIARHAIISLPIDWVLNNEDDPHHQLKNERALSWFAPIVPTRIVEGNGGRRKRLIYVFEDLPAPG